MKVLTFFAHPDDETVFNGGAMALLAQAGVEVHFLSATRGEGGETGDPPICTLDALGEHRSSELACAVEALGGSSLSFLGYVDPRVGPDEALYSFTEDMDQLKARLADRLLDLEVDVLVTHGSNGEYGHPAHRTCHQAAQMAVNSINGPRRPLFYTFAPFFSDHPYPRLTNQDDTADLILDIRPALAQKTAAILCHQTQHNLSCASAPSTPAGGWRSRRSSSRSKACTAPRAGQLKNRRLSKIYWRLTWCGRLGPDERAAPGQARRHLSQVVLWPAVFTLEAWCRFGPGGLTIQPGCFLIAPRKI